MAKVDWNRLERLARKKFGIEEFRPGQKELIEFALTGKSALGTLPTGSGKSLCFQLPSLLLPKSTVVVSPLIALMQDQHEQLAEIGIDAAKLNSTLTSSEEDAVKEAITEGEHNLIYVTPERLENAEYLEVLREQGVSLLVIDEAHCVSQWGHDFRPAYLSIRQARKVLGNPPIMALTATATPEVSQDILKQLGIEDAELVHTGIERENLVFKVIPTVNDGVKKDKLLEILKSPVAQQGAGIIYAATIKVADELCDWLTAQGVSAARYHGKLRIREREQIQRCFMDNEFKVVVATKAFGLGVNKTDVRFVVHYQFPDSLESYYQEAGRAGRDGLPADAILLYQLEDKRIQSYFLGGKYPSRADSNKVLEAFDDGGQTLKELAESTGIAQNKIKVITAYLENAGIIARKRRLERVKAFESAEQLNEFLTAYEARYTSDRERLNQMMRYAQTINCRVKFLREYFALPIGTNCGKCDNCTSVRDLHGETIPRNVA